MPATPDREGLSALKRRWEKEMGVLAERMRPFRLDLTDKRKQRIHRFCELLVRWNRRHALLSRQDIENVLQKHVGASLGTLLVAYPGHEQRWIDVGTGAGLPGLVLKAWEPAQEIVLVEAVRKKGIFLQEVVRELGLGPVDVHLARIETLLERGQFEGEFDVVFARAVADLKRTLHLFGPALRVGGKLITFKGPSWRDDVRDAVDDGILAAGRYELEQVLCVPWAPGHLLSLRKET